MSPFLFKCGILISFFYAALVDSATSETDVGLHEGCKLTACGEGSCEPGYTHYGYDSSACFLSLTSQSICCAPQYLEYLKAQENAETDVGLHEDCTLTACGEGSCETGYTHYGYDSSACFLGLTSQSICCAPGHSDKAFQEKSAEAMALQRYRWENIVTVFALIGLASVLYAASQTCRRKGSIYQGINGVDTQAEV